MLSTLDQCTEAVKAGNQTEKNWQNQLRLEKETHQVEDEAFAAQIQQYEAWQAAMWLD